MAQHNLRAQDSITQASAASPARPSKTSADRRRACTLTGALALACLAACGTTLAATPASEEAPTEVKTVLAEARSVPRTLRLTGTLIAARESLLASDGSGKVVATFVERGDLVKRGDPLARLDARAQSFQNIEAEANTAALDAQAQTDQTECERATRLFAAGAISAAEHDRLSGGCRTRHHSLQAARARARLSAQAVGDSIVRAPFDGVVAERAVDLGEYVVTGSPVARIVDLTSLRLELAVPESALAAVHDGDEVWFGVASYPERRFSGRVRHVGPIVRRDSRDQLIEAVVQDEDRVLRPGMFAVAELMVGTDSLPVVPASALRGSAESRRLFVVSGDRVEERVVLARAQIGDEVAVQLGIAPGERVVAPLTAAVRDGIRVR